jgi:hypothetical protein
METCSKCGLILTDENLCPRCDAERIINAAYPWPESPTAMNWQEAKDWSAKRSRLRFALATFTTFVIGFGAGVYTISQTLHFFIDLK